MYMYMYIYIYIYKDVYRSIQCSDTQNEKDLQEKSHIYICIYICIYIYVYTYVYIYTYMYMYICICIRICIYIYRSIQCSDTQNEKDLQERRQLDIYNDKMKFTIHVFRKELSHIKTDIDVEFETASPQGVRKCFWMFT
jgi:hypothetical protein